MVGCVSRKYAILPPFVRLLLSNHHLKRHPARLKPQNKPEINRVNRYSGILLLMGFSIPQKKKMEGNECL